jgi:hypothetical protein
MGQILGLGMTHSPPLLAAAGGPLWDWLAIPK